MLRGTGVAIPKNLTTRPCSCLGLLQVHPFGLTVRSGLADLRHSQGGPVTKMVVRRAATRSRA
jgi:hypothetical protein